MLWFKDALLQDKQIYPQNDQRNLKLLIGAVGTNWHLRFVQQIIKMIMLGLSSVFQLTSKT